MASLRFPAFFLAVSIIFLLSPAAHCLTCESQKFASKKAFSSCSDLPQLNAYIHWTYDAGKSSLSMAYIAPPASTDGWVAWGINPTSVGMVGTQALIALEQSDGSMTVKTFNLKSYASIQEGAISFNVSDVSAEYSGGNMTIFATWALPTKTTEVNQVWQVGPAVTNGQPARHDTKPENLASTGKLKLVETTSPPVESPKGSSGGESSGTPPAAADEKSNAGDSRMRLKNFGFYGLLVFAALFA